MVSVDIAQLLSIGSCSTLFIFPAVLARFYFNALSQLTSFFLPVIKIVQQRQIVIETNWTCPATASGLIQVQEK